MNFDQYITKYCAGIDFVPGKIITYEISGVEITVQPYTYNNGYMGAEKAHLTLRRNGMVYECDCIDRHSWNDMIFHVTLGGCDYLIFRKTLYGFTLIDAETLAEVYDYFPETVLNGGEAYIFTNAVPFDNLIIFDGCFWGSSYFYTVYDYVEKRCIYLYDEFQLDSDDIAPVIENGTVTLSCTDHSNGRNVKLKLNFTSAQLRKLIREKGHHEL